MSATHRAGLHGRSRRPSCGDGGCVGAECVRRLVGRNQSAPGAMCLSESVPPPAVGTGAWRQLRKASRTPSRRSVKSIQMATGTPTTQAGDRM
ncbi:hypothetical protein WA016_00095 [Myxococcus stipitatus]